MEIGLGFRVVCSSQPTQKTSPAPRFIMPLIFLIEDDDFLREHTQTLLELHGYETKSFKTGDRALEALQSNNPDLILCDVVMPEMNGFDVLARLRGHPHTAAIPVIFVSALAEQDQIRRGMTLGADDYLTKPFTAASLLATVRARIKHSETLRRLSFLHSQQPVESRKLNSMPHELRTPLNGIIGGIEILRESLSNQPENLELVEIVSSSAERLERTLLNYLFYISITSGRHQCPPLENFDLAARVEEIVHGISARYLRHNDLVFHLQSAPTVLCPVCFHRVLTELVDNAFKFSMSCQMVGVSCGWRESDRSWYVTIRDQGIGMNGADVGRISAFRQFERETREQQGMGLGLALSMALACGHGWMVSLQAPEDRMGVVAELRIPERSNRHPSCVCAAYFSHMGAPP